MGKKKKSKAEEPPAEEAEVTKNTESKDADTKGKKKKDKKSKRDKDEQKIEEAKQEKAMLADSERIAAEAKTASSPNRRNRRTVVGPRHLEPTQKNDILSPDLSTVDFLERCGIVAGFENVLCAYVEGGFVWNSPESPLEFAAKQIEQFGITYHKGLARDDLFLEKVSLGSLTTQKKPCDRPMPWDQNRFSEITGGHN